MDLWEIACPFEAGESSMQPQVQQRTAYLPNPNTSATPHPLHIPSPSIDMLQPLTAHMERQMQDMDQCLRLEGELRVTLLQWKQRQEALVQMIQSRTLILLKQKEHEILMATKRTLELEQQLKQTENEKRLYEQSSKMYESTVLALNRTLAQVSNPCLSIIGAFEADDAGSCSAFPSERGEVEPNMKKDFGVCKTCNTRDSSMLLIPCQHLCLCNECEPSVSTCPVCGIIKTEGIEAFFV